MINFILSFWMSGRGWGLSNNSQRPRNIKCSCIAKLETSLLSCWTEGAYTNLPIVLRPVKLKTSTNKTWTSFHIWHHLGQELMASHWCRLEVSAKQPLSASLHFLFFTHYYFLQNTHTHTHLCYRVTISYRVNWHSRNNVQCQPF